ncbi:uncharacterized protein LOC101855252 [Aplysia californica]|uniref:Uncharacterized protein LOC101855252 n=1 Tax=Aplysia californica TaxID=6500 RepID=A0ABM0JNU1_APLCA|nr:uncharacterized protein LOC101855252 [Aplysia californica]
MDNEEQILQMLEKKQDLFRRHKKSQKPKRCTNVTALHKLRCSDLDSRSVINNRHVQQFVTEQEFRSSPHLPAPPIKCGIDTTFQDNKQNDLKPSGGVAPTSTNSGRIIHGGGREKKDSKSAIVSVDPSSQDGKVNTRHSRTPLASKKELINRSSTVKTMSKVTVEEKSFLKDAELTQKQNSCVDNKVEIEDEERGFFFYSTPENPENKQATTSGKLPGPKGDNLDGEGESSEEDVIEATQVCSVKTKFASSVGRRQNHVDVSESGRRRGPRSLLTVSPPGSLSIKSSLSFGSAVDSLACSSTDQKSHHLITDSQFFQMLGVSDSEQGESYLDTMHCDKASNPIESNNSALVQFEKQTSDRTHAFGSQSNTNDFCQKTSFSVDSQNGQSRLMVDTQDVENRSSINSPSCSIESWLDENTSKVISKKCESTLDSLLDQNTSKVISQKCETKVDCNNDMISMSPIGCRNRLKTCTTDTQNDQSRSSFDSQDGEKSTIDFQNDQRKSAVCLQNPTSSETILSLKNASLSYIPLEQKLSPSSESSELMLKALSTNASSPQESLLYAYPTTVPDTEMPVSEMPYSNFTELDAIPYSQFELSEDFLSNEIPFQNFKGVKARKKSISLVKRRSPRIASQSYSGNNSAGIQSSNVSRATPKSTCTSQMSHRQAGSKAGTQGGSAWRTKKAQAIFAIFQVLIEEMKKIPSSEFELPDVYRSLQSNTDTGEKYLESQPEVVPSNVSLDNVPTSALEEGRSAALSHKTAEGNWKTYHPDEVKPSNYLLNFKNVDQTKVDLDDGMSVQCSGSSKSNNALVRATGSAAIRRGSVAGDPVDFTDCIPESEVDTIEDSEPTESSGLMHTGKSDVTYIVKYNATQTVVSDRHTKKYNSIRKEKSDSTLSVISDDTLITKFDKSELKPPGRSNLMETRQSDESDKGNCKVMGAKKSEVKSVSESDVTGTERFDQVLLKQSCTNGKSEFDGPLTVKSHVKRCENFEVTDSAQSYMAPRKKSSNSEKLLDNTTLSMKAYGKQKVICDQIVGPVRLAPEGNAEPTVILESPLAKSQKGVTNSHMVRSSSNMDVQKMMEGNDVVQKLPVSPLQSGEQNKKQTLEQDLGRNVKGDATRTSASLGDILLESELKEKFMCNPDSVLSQRRIDTPDFPSTPRRRKSKKLRHSLSLNRRLFSRSVVTASADHSPKDKVCSDNYPGVESEKEKTVEDVKYAGNSPGERDCVIVQHCSEEMGAKEKPCSDVSPKAKRRRRNMIENARPSTEEPDADDNVHLSSGENAKVLPPALTLCCENENVESSSTLINETEVMDTSGEGVRVGAANFNGFPFENIEVVNTTSVCSVRDKRDNADVRATYCSPVRVPESSVVRGVDHNFSLTSAADVVRQNTDNVMLNSEADDREHTDSCRVSTVRQNINNVNFPASDLNLIHDKVLVAAECDDIRNVASKQEDNAGCVSFTTGQGLCPSNCHLSPVASSPGVLSQSMCEIVSIGVPMTPSAVGHSVGSLPPSPQTPVTPIISSARRKPTPSVKSHQRFSFTSTPKTNIKQNSLSGLPLESPCSATDYSATLGVENRTINDRNELLCDAIEQGPASTTCSSASKVPQHKCLTETVSVHAPPTLASPTGTSVDNNDEVKPIHHHDGCASLTDRSPLGVAVRTCQVNTSVCEESYVSPGQTLACGSPVVTSCCHGQVKSILHEESYVSPGQPPKCASLGVDQRNNKSCEEKTAHHDESYVSPAQPPQCKTPRGTMISMAQSETPNFEESYVMCPGQPVMSSSSVVTPAGDSQEKMSQQCVMNKGRKLNATPSGLTYIWEEGSSGPRHGSFVFTPGRRKSRSGDRRGKSNKPSKTLKFSGCFQSCSQDAVVRLLCGEVILPDGQSQPYVVSVQATALTIWAQTDQEQWAAELDWALSQASHILSSCLLPAKDSVVVVTSGRLSGQPCSDVFVYHWTSETTSRFSLPLAEEYPELSEPSAVLLCPVSESSLHLGMTTMNQYAVRNVSITTPGHCLRETTVSRPCRGQLLDLVVISGESSAALLGLTADQRLLLWNATLGVELKRINVSSSLPCLTRLLAARSCEGVLILDVAWRSEEADWGSSVALNPMSGQMVTLKTYDTPDNMWKRLEELRSEMGFVTAVNDRGSVAIWSQVTGGLLGWVRSGQTTSVAVMGSSLVLGEIHGCLHLYTAG